jgi:hypothetical protein
MALALISLAPIGSNHHLDPTTAVSGRPLLIPQGPLGVSSAGPGDPYWFQQGAIGRTTPCDTCNSVGASVMIRTVYDKLNDDAHSYWVGSLLANGAFVQVGYLNGLSTSNDYYCCAWFYEYFPAGNTESPPIIGPAGSAGPMGTWHTYTMNYTGNGVWSFYMDDQYLGASPAVGQQYYLGPGDTSSGGHAVAALSEVAQTTVTTDVIGPAEFKNFQYETSPNAWQPVPVGNVHIGLGATSGQATNPYSVAAIEKNPNIPNDFLAGSNIPNPGPDECGNQASPTLWSSLTLSCPGSNFSFSFIDNDGHDITPAWISLTDSTGSEIFYTNYQGQTLPTPSGQWSINQISWHAVNVATSLIVNSSGTGQVFPTNIFSITLAVVGYFYALPVKNATVIVDLPDSTTQSLRTDNNGEAVFGELPPATYSVHITVPYGITSNQVHNIAGPGSLVAKVFSLPELITIIVPPILIAVLVAVVVARKELQRQAMMKAQMPTQPVPGPAYCRSCGQPLAPTANFCTSCGTPVRMMVQ